MKTLHLLLFIYFCFESTQAYSKYGRTCKDIGCGSNEECTMAETPCSYYTRENECGMYPTCRKISNSAPSCATYICPPTKKCIVDSGEPKCVDDDQANIPGNQNGNKAYQTYNTQNNNDQPSAPNPNSNPYPVLPGQTTTRPPIRRPAYGGGGGYQGGNPGSGYPGQGGGGYQGGNPGSGYPGQGGGGYQGGNPGSGYPGQGGGGYQGGNVGSGYPGGGGGGGYQGGSVGSGYPGGNQGGSVGSGYPGGARGSQYPGSSNNFGYQGGAAGSGYPQQGNPQQGYPQQGYGGYQPGYGQQGYGQQNYGGRGGYNQNQPAKTSGSNPIYDTLKNTLSKYGTNLLKNALGGLKL